MPESFQVESSRLSGTKSVSMLYNFTVIMFLFLNAVGLFCENNLASTKAQE